MMSDNEVILTTAEPPFERATTLGLVEVLRTSSSSASNAKNFEDDTDHFYSAQNDDPSVISKQVPTKQGTSSSGGVEEPDLGQEERQSSQLQPLWDMFSDTQGNSGSFNESASVLHVEETAQPGMLLVSPSVVAVDDGFASPPAQEKTVTPPRMTTDATMAKDTGSQSSVELGGGEPQRDKNIDCDAEEAFTAAAEYDDDEQAQEFVREVTMVLDEVRSRRNSLIEAGADPSSSADPTSQLPPTKGTSLIDHKEEKVPISSTPPEVSMASAYLAMQQRYLDQVNAGELVTKVKKKTDLQRIPMKMQGNTKFYSDGMLKRRAALRVNPDTIWVLAQLWLKLPRDTLPQYHLKGSSSTSGATTEIPQLPSTVVGVVDNATTKKGEERGLGHATEDVTKLMEIHCECFSITKTTYQALSAFLWKRLIPQGNYKELEAVLEVDWQRETQYRDDNRMHFVEFCDSLFVTIDVWCPTMSLNDYTLFGTQIVGVAARKAAKVDPHQPFNAKVALAPPQKNRRKSAVPHSHWGTATHAAYGINGDQNLHTGGGGTSGSPTSRRGSRQASPKPMLGGGGGGGSFDANPYAETEPLNPTTAGGGAGVVRNSPSRRSPNMERLEQLATPRGNLPHRASFTTSGSPAPTSPTTVTSAPTEGGLGVVGTAAFPAASSSSSSGAVKSPVKGLDLLEQQAASPTARRRRSSVSNAAGGMRRKSSLTVVNQPRIESSAAADATAAANSSNSTSHPTPTLVQSSASPSLPQQQQAGAVSSMKPHPKSLLSAYKKVITFVYLVNPLPSKKKISDNSTFSSSSSSGRRKSSVSGGGTAAKSIPDGDGDDTSHHHSPSSSPINLEQIRAHHKAIILQAASQGTLESGAGMGVQSEAQVTAAAVEFLKRSFGSKDSWRSLSVALAETLKTTPLVVTVVNPPLPEFLDKNHVAVGGHGAPSLSNDFLVDDFDHQVQISPVEANPGGYKDYSLAVELLVLPIPQFHANAKEDAELLQMIGGKPERPIRRLARSMLVLPSPILSTTTDHSDSSTNFRSYISIVHSSPDIDVEETQYAPKLASTYYQQRGTLEERDNHAAALFALPTQLPVYQLAAFISTLGDLLGRPNQTLPTAAPQHHDAAPGVSGGGHAGGVVGSSSKSTHQHHIQFNLTDDDSSKQRAMDPSPEGETVRLRQQQNNNNSSRSIVAEGKRQQQQHAAHRYSPQLDGGRSSSPPQHQGVMVARSAVDDILVVLPEPTQIVSHKAAIGRKLTKYHQVSPPHVDAESDRHASKPRPPSVQVRFPYSTKPSALVTAQNEMRRQGRAATEVVDPTGEAHANPHAAHYIDSISTRSGHGQMSRRFVAVVDGGGNLKKDQDASRLLQEALATHTDTTKNNKKQQQQQLGRGPGGSTTTPAGHPMTPHKPIAGLISSGEGGGGSQRKTRRGQQGGGEENDDGSIAPSAAAISVKMMDRRPLMPPSEVAQMSIQVFEGYDRPFLINKVKAAQFTRSPPSHRQQQQQHHTMPLKRHVGEGAATSRQKSQTCVESVIQENARLGGRSQSSSRARATLEQAVLSENNARKQQQRLIARGKADPDSVSPRSHRDTELLTWAEKAAQDRLAPKMTVDTRPVPTDGAKKQHDSATTTTAITPHFSYTQLQKAQTARVRTESREKMVPLRPSGAKQLEEDLGKHSEAHPQHGANLAHILYGEGGSSPPASPQNTPSRGGRGGVSSMSRRSPSPENLLLPPLSSLASYTVNGSGGGVGSATGGDGEGGHPSFAARAKNGGPQFLLSKRTVQESTSGAEYSVWEVAKKKQQIREVEKSEKERENFLSSYAHLQKELLALPIDSASTRDKNSPRQSYEPTAEQNAGFHIPFSRVPHPSH